MGLGRGDRATAWNASVRLLACWIRRRSSRPCFPLSTSALRSERGNPVHSGCRRRRGPPPFWSWIAGPGSEGCLPGAPSWVPRAPRPTSRLPASRPVRRPVRSVCSPEHGVIMPRRRDAHIEKITYSVDACERRSRRQGYLARGARCRAADRARSGDRQECVRIESIRAHSSCALFLPIATGESTQLPSPE